MTRLSIVLLHAFLSLPLAAKTPDPHYLPPPIPICTAQASYTEAARARGIEGVVFLTVTIDAEGVPTEIKIAKALDPDLDQQAILAAHRRRFRPGKNGALPATATIQMAFRLATPQLLARKTPAKQLA